MKALVMADISVSIASVATSDVLHARDLNTKGYKGTFCSPRGGPLPMEPYQVKGLGSHFRLVKLVT